MSWALWTPRTGNKYSIDSCICTFFSHITPVTCLCWLVFYCSSTSFRQSPCREKRFILMHSSAWSHRQVVGCAVSGPVMKLPLLVRAHNRSEELTLCQPTNNEVGEPASTIPSECLYLLTPSHASPLRTPCPPNNAAGLMPHCKPKL